MPAAIEAFGCAFLQSLLLLQSFAVISIFYHTSCRYYMTASFSGRPSAMPAVFHIAFSACLFSNYFSFAASPAAPRSFLLPFSLACLLSAHLPLCFTAVYAFSAARFVLFRIRYVFLLRRHFRCILDSKPRQKRTAYAVLIFVHTIQF